VSNKPNAMLRKRSELIQGSVDVGIRIGKQLMLDSIQTVLFNRDEEVWNYDALCQLTEDVLAVFEEYEVGLTKSVEADVARSHADQVFEKICAGHAKPMPFEERFPEAKLITYKGPKERR